MVSVIHETEAPEAEAATKNQVFNAAERLFALHGFQNVSVRDITAEAGVNLASVNYHFGSKDALLFEIFRRRTGGLPPWRSEDSCSMRARSRFSSAVRRRKISNSRASLEPKW